MLCCAVLCCAVLCCAVLYCTVLFCSVLLYSAILFFAAKNFLIFSLALFLIFYSFSTTLILTPCVCVWCRVHGASIDESFGRSKHAVRHHGTCTCVHVTYCTIDMCFVITLSHSCALHPLTLSINFICFVFISNVFYFSTLIFHFTSSFSLPPTKCHIIHINATIDNNELQNK